MKAKLGEQKIPVGRGGGGHGGRKKKNGETDIDYVLLCHCEFWDLFIQGIQVNIDHEVDSMQLLSWINAGRKNSSLTQHKWQSPQVQMRAVGDFGGKKEQVHLALKVLWMTKFV